MSQENLLTWIVDFLEDNPRIQKQVLDHILQDDDISQEEVEEAFDDFLNSH